MADKLTTLLSRRPLPPQQAAGGVINLQVNVGEQGLLLIDKLSREMHDMFDALNQALSQQHQGVEGYLGPNAQHMKSMMDSVQQNASAMLSITQVIQSVQKQIENVNASILIIIDVIAKLNISPPEDKAENIHEHLDRLSREIASLKKPDINITPPEYILEARRDHNNRIDLSSIRIRPKE